MPLVDGSGNICKLSDDQNIRSISKQATCHHNNNDIANLYIKYNAHIKHFIASHIGFNIDVEDLTQEVFIKFYEIRIPQKDDSYIKGYLFGIAKNIIRKYIRKKQKKKINIISFENIRNIEIHLSISQNHDNDETNYKQKLRTMLLELKYKLSSQMYQTILLNFFERLSPEQAASKMGCSVQAYKKRLQRATRITEQIIKQSDD